MLVAECADQVVGVSVVRDEKVRMGSGQYIWPWLLTNNRDRKAGRHRQTQTVGNE